MLGTRLLRAAGPRERGRLRLRGAPRAAPTVAWTPGGAGLSQHMWWNLDCITWQIYNEGDSSWSVAVNRAHQVKGRREYEDWQEKEGSKESNVGVVPARSAHHRAAVHRARQDTEPELEPPEEIEEEDKKKKKRRRRHKRSLRRLLVRRWSANVAADHPPATTSRLGGVMRRKGAARRVPT